MPSAQNHDVTIEYDTFGDPADPAVLLVMGFTAQMIAWDEELCRLIAGHGLHVIRFDNRDCGLSSKTPGDPPNVMALVMAAQAGRAVGDVPYTLSDMATDGLAVLDHLGIDRAHVVGASMGGMIAQMMAIEHPERVATLTSIMSTTGDPSVGQASPAAMAALIAPPPTDREGVIEAGVKLYDLIGGSYEVDEDLVRQRMAASFDRCFYPIGAAFQMAAIVATGDRTERLASVTAPTLVVHGLEDSLIAPSGGEATAAAVPGAELVTYDRMGHDLPRQIWDDLVGRLARHTLSAPVA